MTLAVAAAIAAAAAVAVFALAFALFALVAPSIGPAGGAAVVGLVAIVAVLLSGVIAARKIGAKKNTAPPAPPTLTEEAGPRSSGPALCYRPAPGWPRGSTP